MWLECLTAATASLKAMRPVMMASRFYPTMDAVLLVKSNQAGTARERDACENDLDSFYHLILFNFKIKNKILARLDPWYFLF